MLLISFAHTFLLTLNRPFYCWWLIKSFLVMSSIDKWGGQLKTIKRENRDFMILELKSIKNCKPKIKGVKNLFDLLGFCKMSLLVPYNSKIIKSRISRFVILSWPPHLSILLMWKYKRWYLKIVPEDYHPSRQHL